MGSSVFNVQVQTAHAGQVLSQISTAEAVSRSLECFVARREL